MKKKFLIALCGILCITTIGCTSKQKYDTGNNQIDKEVGEEYNSSQDDSDKEENNEDISEENLDYGDFADLTVYESRFMSKNSITPEEQYKVIKKALKGVRYSKEKIEFTEKHLKLLSRVADKILSDTSRDVLMTDIGEYGWKMTMDEITSENFNLNRVSLMLRIQNLNRDEAGSSYSEEEINNSRMDVHLTLSGKTITDELYYVLQEVISKFSKEEWQELIDKAYKDGERLIMDIEDMQLRIKSEYGETEILIITSEKYE